MTLETDEEHLNYISHLADAVNIFFGDHDDVVTRYFRYLERAERKALRMKITREDILAAERVGFRRKLVETSASS